MTACTPAKVPKGQKVTVKTHLPIPHLSRTNSKCCKALRVLSISHIKLVNLTATADKMPARAKVSDASVSANFGRQKNTLYAWDTLPVWQVAPFGQASGKLKQCDENDTVEETRNP